MTIKPSVKKNGKRIDSRAKRIPARKKTRRLRPEEMYFLANCVPNGNSIGDMLNIVKRATQEVINLISDECFLILECKVCKNWFGTFLDFKDHKPETCKASSANITCSQQDNSSLINSRSSTKSDIPKIFEQRVLQSLLKEIGSDPSQFTGLKKEILPNSTFLNKDLFKQRYPVQESKMVLTPTPVPEYFQGIQANSRWWCPQCNKSFISERNCNRHVQNEHNALRKIENTQNCPEKKELNVRCRLRSKPLQGLIGKFDEEKAFVEELKSRRSLDNCQFCYSSLRDANEFQDHVCPSKNNFLQSLKRKSLTPFKISSENTNSSNSDSYTDISNKIARDHVETAEIEPMSEEHVKYFADRYRGDIEIDSSIDEDMLNTLHTKVPIYKHFSTTDDLE